MLDLEKLERKLDKALANETSESLSDWLKQKRKKNYGKYLGDGSIEDMDHTSSKIGVSFNTKSVTQKDNSTPNYDFYKSAA